MVILNLGCTLGDPKIIGETYKFNAQVTPQANEIRISRARTRTSVLSASLGVPGVEKSSR